MPTHHESIRWTYDRPMSIRIWQLPLRLATGAYILNSGIGKRAPNEERARRLKAQAELAYPQFAAVEPLDFLKLLSRAEIVLGVALLLLFLRIFPGIGLGTEAQVIGQVTFTLSYVVVIVRGRLVSIGPEFEEAAADLGAPPRDQLFRVVLPLLAPAIVASAAVAFAISIDDFVVTQYLSSDASTTTVSMLLYSNARGAPTPALNAIATVGLAITLLTLIAAFLVYRRFAGGQEAASLATMEV